MYSMNLKFNSDYFTFLKFENTSSSSKVSTIYNQHDFKTKIDDISRIFAGVNDEFDVPYWGWCP